MHLRESYEARRVAEHGPGAIIHARGGRTRRANPRRPKRVFFRWYGMAKMRRDWCIWTIAKLQIHDRSSGHDVI